MEVDDVPTIDPNVDYREILPIHQKRMIAFINHFILTTVSFLNDFSKSCESRLMEFEYKIQKVEASLLILESQLSSISGLSASDNSNSNASANVNDKTEPTLDLPEITKDDDNSVSVEGTQEQETKSPASDLNVPKACEDPRYRKFFKMVQFGVPQQAVKLKMETEGIDSTILDNPNETVGGYEEYLSSIQSNESTDSDSS